MGNVGKINTNELNASFVNLTEGIKGYLTSIKAEFDFFDAQNSSRESRTKFVLENKDNIFQKLNSHFASIWKIASNFDKQSYLTHADFYRQALSDLLLKAEINKHIYEKPLGYAGDYITMNNIYNYHNGFLGTSSYDILINYYTCNIPIAISNIKRKDYLKEQILSVLSHFQNPKIASFGSGPARELIELLDENKINKKVKFYCVDFEEKALDFARDELAKRGNNNLLDVAFLKIDIRNLIRSKKIEEKLNNIDLLYASGLFDYLGDRFAEKAVPILFNLLSKSGYMILVNASSENDEMRAYYEMLGTWEFYHRKKDQILAWTRQLSNQNNISFEDVYSPNNYFFMKICR